mmetsp:Transcript_30123/g.87464  ORF Transcript_30123/g.87464 Transcript_30123/m.87464 type:complete len:924 (+) Transcript_30123:216-2987(+)
MRVGGCRQQAGHCQVRTASLIGCLRNWARMRQGDTQDESVKVFATQPVTADDEYGTSSAEEMRRPNIPFTSKTQPKSGGRKAANAGKPHRLVDALGSDPWTSDSQHASRAAEKESVQQLLIEQERREIDVTAKKKGDSNTHTKAPEPAAQQKGAAKPKTETQPKGAAKTTAAGGVDGDTACKLRQLVEALKGNGGPREILAIQQARQLLKKAEEPVKKAAREAGMIPALVKCLAALSRRPDQCLASYRLQVEVLTQVGDLVGIGTLVGGHQKQVVDAGGIPILVKLVSSKDGDLLLAAAWMLGLVTGSRSEHRDTVLKEGGLSPLLQRMEDLTPEADPLGMVRTAVLGFVRHNQLPPLQLMEPSLPLLAQMVNGSSSAATLHVVCAIVFELSEGGNDDIDAVVRMGVCPRLVELMKWTCPGDRFERECHALAVMTVRNVAGGANRHRDAVLQCGALAPMPQLLTSGVTYAYRVMEPEDAISEFAIQTLGNIMAGNSSHTQKVIDANLMRPLLKALTSAGPAVKKETARALANATEQVRHLGKCGFVKSLCDVLKTTDDADIVKMVRGALQKSMPHSRDDIRAAVHQRDMPDKERLFLKSIPNKASKAQDFTKSPSSAAEYAEAQRIADELIEEERRAKSKQTKKKGGKASKGNKVQEPAAEDIDSSGRTTAASNNRSSFTIYYEELPTPPSSSSADTISLALAAASEQQDGQAGVSAAGRVEENDSNGATWAKRWRRRKDKKRQGGEGPQDAGEPCDATLGGGLSMGTEDVRAREEIDAVPRSEEKDSDDVLMPMPSSSSSAPPPAAQSLTVGDEDHELQLAIAASLHMAGHPYEATRTSSDSNDEDDWLNSAFAQGAKRSLVGQKNNGPTSKATPTPPFHPTKAFHPKTTVTGRPAAAPVMGITGVAAARNRHRCPMLSSRP